MTLSSLQFRGQPKELLLPSVHRDRKTVVMLEEQNFPLLALESRMDASLLIVRQVNNRFNANRIMSREYSCSCTYWQIPHLVVDNSDEAMIDVSSVP